MSNNNADSADIEAAALKALANFCAPEELYIPDPDTGEMVYINMKNPSDEAMVLLDKLFGGSNES